MSESETLSEIVSTPLAVLQADSFPSLLLLP